MKSHSRKVVFEMDIVLWGSVLVAGVLSFFSPCILPLFPVYFGVLMSEQGTRKIKLGKLEIYGLPLLRTGLFVLGISTIFFLLGFAATLLGQVVYNPYIHIGLGLVIVLLGLHQMELFQLTLLQRQKTVQFEMGDERSLLRSYLLGVSFSFGWTPCVGPVLSSVLGLVATKQAGIVYGFFLLLIYIIGLALPFLCLAIASTVAFKWFNVAKKHLLLLKKIGGFVIVVMGLLIIFSQVMQLIQ